MRLLLPSALLAAALLAGCLGENPNITYDITGETDRFSVALELAFIGRSEGDRSPIGGPHVAGGVLGVSARYKDIFSSLRDGSLESRDESVVRVAVQDSAGANIDATLSFTGPGETQLWIRNSNGVVVDRQNVVVRAAAGVGLSSADDLDAGVHRPTPLDEPLHLVAGSEATFAYSYVDADETPLTGSGLMLTLWDEDIEIAGVGLDRWEVEQGSLFDVFDIEVAAGIANSSGNLLHTLDGVLNTRQPVTVHELEEITALTLEQHPIPTAGGNDPQGHVLAVPLVGAGRVHGLAAEWTDSAGLALGTGTMLSWLAGDATEVRACLPEGTCGWATLPGRPGEVSSGSVSTCSSAGQAPVGLLAFLPLLALARLRRRA